MARSGVDKYVPIFGKRRKTIYTQIGYTTDSTKMQFLKKFQEGGYGNFGVVNEGVSITTSGFFTGYSKDFYWAKYGGGDERSYESYDTDIYGLTKKISMKLSKAEEETKEYLSANQFLNMTSTGVAYVGMDGVALCSASHPYDGGTWSNRGVDTGGSTNVDVDLSAPNLELAVQKLHLVVNHKGKPDPRMGPFKLVVPTALVGLANRLVKAQLLPQSANNDPNWAGGQISGVIENPWLDAIDPDMWMLIAGEDENGLFMLTHGSPLTETDINKRKQLIAQLRSFKILFQCEDARGFWGSPGA